MSEKVTVPKSMLDDPSYRYWRPTLAVEITKKNIILKNIKEIADAIEVDMNILIKYLITTLNRPITINKNNIVQMPNFSKKELGLDVDDLIEQYIVQYLVCTTCSNPETYISVTKKKLLVACNSCGSTHEIENMELKFNKFLATHFSKQIDNKQ